MRTGRLLSGLVVLTLPAVAACATTVAGTPVSVLADPFRVAGMPAADGPTGLRPNAPVPARVVLGTDGGGVDELARNAVSDVEEFWNTAYAETFGADFVPVTDVMSWDSDGVNTVFCGGETFGVVNAGYCAADDTIGWDRGTLMPSLRNANGDMGLTMVLAHEYGHAVADRAGLSRAGTPTLVSEQQADCLTGAYMRWVAEGRSPRFTLSTADGLDDVLSAMVAFRDPLMNEDGVAGGGNEHGSAFERVSAFQFGFGDGAAACPAIDETEVEQRRGDLPVLAPADRSGEAAIDENSVRAYADVMPTLFEVADPPTLSFATAACPDSTSTDPAVYCPATNTVAVDLAALRRLANPSAGAGSATGDYSAYSVVVSRYALALQRERGVELDTAQTALRTACLTGAATAKMATPVTTPDGESIVVTAGDLDEAVSELLVDGYAAGDVNGATVPAGFSRIDAFRVGVLGDAERCFRRFD